MTKYYDGHDKVYRQLLVNGREAWDGLAFDAPRISNLLDRAQEFMPCTFDQASVLEIGCGTGPISCEIARRGSRVTGIDLSESAIEAARRLSAARHVRVRFEVQDVCAMTAATGEYDLVVDANCMHCIVSAQDRASVLSGIRSAMKESGVFLYQTMAFSPTMKFSENFVYDELGTLWVRVGDDGMLEPSRMIAGRRHVPNRRIGRSADLHRELAAAGYDILWSDTETEPGDQPASFRAIARARTASRSD